MVDRVLDYNSLEVSFYVNQIGARVKDLPRSSPELRPFRPMRGVDYPLPAASLGGALMARFPSRVRTGGFRCPSTSGRSTAGRSAMCRPTWPSWITTGSAFRSQQDTTASRTTCSPLAWRPHGRQPGHVNAQLGSAAQPYMSVDVRQSICSPGSALVPSCRWHPDAVLPQSGDVPDWVLTVPLLLIAILPVMQLDPVTYSAKAKVLGSSQPNIMSASATPGLIPTPTHRWARLFHGSR